LYFLATNAWVAEGEEEHSAADHAEHMQDAEHEHDAAHQHSVERDAEGRRLHDMKHEITDEIADELRAKVPSFEDYSNADIGMSMAMMGPNYEWYISDAELVGDRGLLILAHGFRDRGDRDFTEQVRYALEISIDPDNEVVIIVAHGPSFADDNAEELRMLANPAEFMMEDSDFVNVVGMTLQDDAPQDIRNANVERIRAVVVDATAEGKEVLVVTNLMGTRTIQSQLRRDLAGLDYRFNAKGLTQHDNFIKWMGVTLRAEMDRS
jgi:hypothetical protein